MLGLAACQPGNTRIDDPNYRAQNGAMAGALLGGIIGASTGSNSDARLRSTLVGAAIGAAAGGAIGANLDQQAADLRNSLGNPNVTVTNMGDYLLVNLPRRPAVRHRQRRRAARICRARSARSPPTCVSYPNSRIQVLGHTDNTGTAAYNHDLSQRRAVAVAGILIGAGVPSSRLSAVGIGEDRPSRPTRPPPGRAQNRRVEIIITPNT